MPVVIRISEDVQIGGDVPLLIAGPCVVENHGTCVQVAEIMIPLCRELGFAYVFKSSFDKANRTSNDSFRSIGFEEALRILDDIRSQYRIPIITDVHESKQVKPVAEVADILQIPAFLCRQTDLLLAAGNTGKPVNVKKGQFMAPEDMENVVKKIQSTGNSKVMLTERGTSFGYHNLVVDFRSLDVMRHYAPVIFDVTHSIQTPSAAGTTSGGQREYAPVLARAAAAAGVDGFFIETHPDPDHALSDGPNSIPLDRMEGFLEMIMQFWPAGKKYVV